MGCFGGPLFSETPICKSFSQVAVFPKISPKAKAKLRTTTQVPAQQMPAEALQPYASYEACLPTGLMLSKEGDFSVVGDVWHRHTKNHQFHGVGKVIFL